MNVTLIGMSGAGKSHIGKRLAERLDLEFLDIDALLEQVFKKPIQRLLDEMGEEKYMDAEGEMLIQGTSGRENLVISPGGSVVYRSRTMERVKDISTVVYLWVPFEVIEERNKNMPPHAVIGLGKKTLKQLYEERHPLYEKHADLVVNAHTHKLDEILAEISSFVQKLVRPFRTV